jgi:P27 family predicted phage terminase small subunit
MSRKKTEAAKKLQGTYRNDRKEQAVAGIDEIPPPRKFLSRKAMKDIYYFIAEHLKKNASLQHADSLLISQAALNVYLLEKASRDVIKHGTTYKSKESDYIGLNAYYTVFRREREQLEKYCKELGIGIASREKIHAFAAEILPKEEAEIKDPVAKVRAIRS